MRPARAYDGLTLARQRLFDWIRPLGQEQYTREFPIGLHTLQATMIEIATGEWLHTHRLRGETPPPRDAWPITPAHLPLFADLEPVWTEQAKATRALLAGITDWDREIEYRVPQGERTIVITATAGDIATHLLFHEVHHRAQAMAMLRQLGVEAQNLDYSAFMYRRRDA